MLSSGVGKHNDDTAEPSIKLDRLKKHFSINGSNQAGFILLRMTRYRPIMCKKFVKCNVSIGPIYLEINAFVKIWLLQMFTLITLHYVQKENILCTMGSITVQLVSSLDRF